MFAGRLSHFFRFWLPWHIYLVLVFLLSSFPRADRLVGFQVSDVIVHPLEYLLLPFFTLRAFRSSGWPWLKGSFFVVGVLFCLAYAASDELHQRLVPGRAGTFGDTMLDWIGIFSGTFLYCLLSERDLRRETLSP